MPEQPNLPFEESISQVSFEACPSREQAGGKILEWFKWGAITYPMQVIYLQESSVLISNCQELQNWISEETA